MLAAESYNGWHRGSDSEGIHDFGGNENEETLLEFYLKPVRSTIVEYSLIFHIKQMYRQD